MAFESIAPAVNRRGAPATALETAWLLGHAAIVILLLTISPLAMVDLDWRYYDTGGSFLDKFHPSTLIAFALVLLPIVTARNPLSASLAFVERNIKLMPFVFAILFTMVYAAQLFGHSFTIFIETFLGAVAMHVLFSNLDESARRKLALLIHLLLFVNALLAFYEVFTGFRLTPLVVNGEELLDEPRATALLGHPLSNAMVAGCYVTVLALGGGKDLPRLLRTPLLFVALASLVPFGGRAATATCILTLLMIGAGVGARIMRGQKFSTENLFAALFMFPVCAIGLVTAFELGWLDTLLDRLVDDEGSAGTRIVMFELFNHFTFSELFWGANPQELATWVRLYGLEYGIESFLVAFILHYGIFTAIVFMPNFFYFLYLIVRATGTRKTWFPIFYFFVVALASVSLSSKSPVLSIIVMIVLTLMRDDKQARA
jgi:hypothetical protein